MGYGLELNLFSLLGLDFTGLAVEDEQCGENSPGFAFEEEASA